MKRQFKKMSRKKIVFLFAIFVLGISAPIQIITSNAYATNYEAQLKKLQAEIDANNEKAKKKAEEAGSLKNELAVIDAEKSAAEATLSRMKVEHKRTEEEIKKAEEDIKNNKLLLGEMLAEMHIQQNETPLLTLVKEDNFAKLFDALARQDSMQRDMVESTKKVESLKKELEEKEKLQKIQLVNQENVKKQIIAKSNEKQELINKTKGEEANYRAVVAERENRRAEVMKQQQAEIEAAMRRAGGNSTYVNSLAGDYPWSGGNCYVDGNAMSHGGSNGNGGDGNGYGCRQCASYAAWRAQKETGRSFYGWGNANQFPYTAASAGYAVGSTPRAKALGVISSGYYGHVVYIEEVRGGQVLVAQYNAWHSQDPGWGKFSREWVPANTYDKYIYL
ncbi:MAG: CHAP domain-containing protein [Candidatus Saccharibacteria bacterium]|jgi:staphylococcal secretory antigen ssaA1